MREEDKTGGGTPKPPSQERAALAETLKQHRVWLNTDGTRGAHANLANADLHGADLRGATLQRAVLRGANLRGANLANVDLENAVLNDAVLKDVNLADANLKGVKPPVPIICETTSLVRLV